MSNSTPKRMSFWAYFFTREESVWQARQNKCSFVDDSDDDNVLLETAWCVYDKLKPFGPMQMYAATINKQPGMLLALGYPHDKLEDLPPLLLKNAIRLFILEPRRVTLVKGKRNRYTTPAEDGQGVDKIVIDETPEASNCEWPEPDDNYAPITSPPPMRTFIPPAPQVRTPNATPRKIRTPHATSPRAEKTMENQNGSSTDSYTSFMMGAMLSAVVVIVANNYVGCR